MLLCLSRLFWAAISGVWLLLLRADTTDECARRHLQLAPQGANATWSAARASRTSTTARLRYEILFCVHRVGGGSVTRRWKASAAATTAARSKAGESSPASATGVPLALKNSSMQAGVNATASRAPSPERTR